MKKIFDSSLLINAEQTRMLLPLSLAIVLLNTYSLYDALAVTILTVPMLILCVAIDALFNRFSIESLCPTVSYMLCGAVTAAYCAFGNIIHYNIFAIALGAFVICFVLTSRYRNENGSHINKLKKSLKIYAYIAIVLLIFGLFREFLATGCIFNTFVSGGIKIFPKKFGGYVYTASGAFLILTIIDFVIHQLIRRQRCTIDVTGITLTVAVSSLLGLIITILLFIIAKINIPGITLILPFVLIALIFFIPAKYLPISTAEFIAVTCTVFIYIFSGLSGNFLTNLILSASVLMISNAIIFLSEISFRSKRGTTSLSILLCAVFAFIYEAVVSSIL